MHPPSLPSVYIGSYTRQLSHLIPGNPLLPTVLSRVLKKRKLLCAGRCLSSTGIILWIPRKPPHKDKQTWHRESLRTALLGMLLASLRVSLTTLPVSACRFTPLSTLVDTPSRTACFAKGVKSVSWLFPECQLPSVSRRTCRFSKTVNSRMLSRNH